MLQENTSLKKEIDLLKDELNMNNALKDQMLEDIVTLSNEMHDDIDNDSAKSQLIQLRLQDIKQKKQLVEMSNDMIRLMNNLQEKCNDYDKIKNINDKPI